jgi:eukaryotic-like serine/threonine-protein kinase
MSDRIGQQIGHYRLERLLGHGGFADVYLGEHIYLGTCAAIKILDTHLSATEIEHFRQEARIIAQLEHPHIVRILDFGVEDDIPFLVMSYAPNGSLRQRYTAGVPLALETVIAFVKQIASALYYAHQAKVVHRDVKPENILLGRNNEILLSDFGLAIVSQNSSQQQIQDVSGTIAYMAPEQARGKPQPASDQYALALIAYEWLSGKRPFHGTYEEVMVQHAFNRPPSLSEYLPAITPALDAIIMRALEKDPHLRFSTVQDFARTLEETHLAGLGITLAPSSLATYYEDTAAQIQIAVPNAAERVKPGADTIYTVAWSPDKRRIAYGGRGHTIQVRGATTGDSTLAYQKHSRSVTIIAWSPDGQSIASTGLDRTIHIWDVASGETKAIYTGHNGIVSALDWSPDNKYIASTSNGTDNTIHVWVATSGQLQIAYKGHAQWVRTIAWSPNGKAVASGAWHEIHIWDCMQARRLFSYRGHPSWIRAIDWSPNGTRIASAGEENSVQIWEPLNKGHLITEYHGHDDWVGTMLWSPDGAWIASASKDQKVHIWDTETASNVSLHHVRTASAYAITWLSDSKHVVSANGNGSVQVWNIKSE